MKTSSLDTAVEAEQKQFELLRNLSHAKRAELAVSLTNTLRHLIIADLKQRFSTASDEEIRRRFIARVLTRRDVIRTYGFDPEKEGY